MLATLAKTSAVNSRQVDDPKSIQTLIFQRQGCLFALPLAAVREMTAARNVTLSDSVAGELKGVYSIGRSVVPVVDLVEHASIAIPEASVRLIVVSHRSQLLGIMHDRVLEICPIQPGLITGAARFGGGAEWPAFHLDHQRVAYLQPSRLMTSLDLARFDSHSANALELVG